MSPAVLAEAWATGYATVPAENTLPLTGHGRAKAQATIEAAAQLSSIPDPIGLLVEAGAAAAAATANHRARLRLYAAHRKDILAAALPLLAHVDTETLAMHLDRIAQYGRPVRYAFALTTLRATVFGPGSDTDPWTAALGEAKNAAVRRGRAEAAASPGPGKPPPPSKVATILRTGQADGQSIDLEQPETADVGDIDRGLARLAWDLSPRTLIDSPNPDTAVSDVVTSGKSIGDEAEDAMHAWLGGGYKKWLIDHQITEMFWQSADDDRTCPTCIALEDGSPYNPADPDLPEMPAHPTCRCNWA